MRKRVPRHAHTGYVLAGGVPVDFERNRFRPIVSRRFPSQAGLLASGGGTADRRIAFWNTVRSLLSVPNARLALACAGLALALACAGLALALALALAWPAQASRGGHPLTSVCDAADCASGTDAADCVGWRAVRSVYSGKRHVPPAEGHQLPSLLADLVAALARARFVSWIRE